MYSALGIQEAILSLNNGDQILAKVETSQLASWMSFLNA